MTVRIEEDGAAVRLWIKAVPGSSRDHIAGALGDRLKVRVIAAPEGGKANAAICALIARALGIRAGQVTIASGHASPEKIVRIQGTSAQQARALLE